MTSQKAKMPAKKGIIAESEAKIETGVLER